MNSEKRFAQLERQIKQQRLGLLGLSFALAVGILVGMQDSQPSTVNAKAINVMDDEGKVRLALGIDENGAGLTLLDPEGKPILVVGRNDKDKSTGIAIFDSKANPRIAMGTKDNGEAGITLIGAGMSEALSGSTWPTPK